MQRALQLYFGQRPPSVDKIGLQLGLSGKGAGSLNKFLSACQSHEVTLAEEGQEADLSGQIEGGAASSATLRRVSFMGCHRPFSSFDQGRFHAVYSVCCASSQRSGKPLLTADSRTPNRRLRLLRPRLSRGLGRTTRHCHYGWVLFMPWILLRPWFVQRSLQPFRRSLLCKKAK